MKGPCIFHSSNDPPVRVIIPATNESGSSMAIDRKAQGYGGAEQTLNKLIGLASDLETVNTSS